MILNTKIFNLANTNIILISHVISSRGSEYNIYKNKYNYSKQTFSSKFKFNSFHNVNINRYPFSTDK